MPNIDQGYFDRSATQLDPQPPRGIDQVCSALQAAAILANRIETIVGRIVGHVPMPIGQTAKDQTSPASTMDRLRTEASAAAFAIAQANEQLDRLEREL